MKVLLVDDDRVFMDTFKEHVELLFADEVQLDTYSSLKSIGMNKIDDYSMLVIDNNLEGDDEKGIDFITRVNNGGFKGKIILATGEGNFFLKTKVKLSNFIYLEKGTSAFYTNIELFISDELMKQNNT